MEALVRFSLRERALVVVLAALLVGVGLWSFQRLPIDAVPDITNVQVQINTQAKALAPAEIEKLITFPIETAMSGLPGVEDIRSLTHYGLSQVTVVFEDGTNIYFARQLVLERLQEAKEQLPKGVAEPMMGPISTGLGEIFLYHVDGDRHSAMELRTIQDWMIRPQLRTVPGVAEVNSVGGFKKEYDVLVDPWKLTSYGLTFRDVFEALAANNANAGGAYIEHKGEQYVVRGVGFAQSIADLESIVLATRGGVPIYVGEVAEIALGQELRTGTATERGREVVEGTALMRMGENSRTVSIRVREKLEEIQKTLPEGVKIRPVYDRTYLVEQTLGTVERNLVEGAALVIAILFLMLANVRAALIVASAIPLSMLFAVTVMDHAGISGNLMSLGAIDFGLIVDGAVVMVENILRRLADRRRERGSALSPEERREVIQQSAVEMARPVTFGVATIMIVYLPILTLRGIEGKMFRPMAFTVLSALAGSLVLALTFVPALCSLVLGTGRLEGETMLVRVAKRVYAPLLERTWGWRWRLVLGGGVLIAAALWMFTRLGAEFVPRLDEGAMAMEIYRLPSIALTQAAKMQGTVEKALLEFPEVENVFARIGTAEVATDPFGPDRSDVYVMLRPREDWKTAKTKADLIRRMQERLSHVPGGFYEFSQPIELRFNELISGVRSDVGVKVFGEDINTLKQVAERIRSLLEKVPGAEDVIAESVSGQPVIDIEVDRQAIARHGVNVADVLELVEVAIGGKVAGQIIEAEQRADLLARLPAAVREKPDELAQLTVRTPAGALIPLSELAHIQTREGLSQINRENGQRRLAVLCNVRGRDLGSFIAEVQARIAKDITLPAGYRIEYGGQFENLEAARRRLAVIVPVALGLIFFLLYRAFGSVRQALLVFSGVPLAVTGGVFSLALRGLPFSISAGIGFIALSGVAVLNGVVMVTNFNRLREDGKAISDAVSEGALARLRPVLMTALVASLGFVPMAIATGTGAEVQRPLATVVIGGIVTSTVLTLVVLPTLYVWALGRTAAPPYKREPESRGAVLGDEV